MTQTVPLNKLILSPRNVRKSNGEEDIAGLADSIHSKGLLQNLVVSPGTVAKHFEVDAGGRRWRALQLLAERKDLPRNFSVPVIVVPRDDALEASLAENLQKVAMNPADEVEAFAAIVDGYEDSGIVDQAERIANCARRFGRTVNYVRQRLALAALAPEILAALREGRITIGAAKAYATHPDPAVQLKVFAVEERSPYNSHAPGLVKHKLAGKIYQIDHLAVRFIGVDAYREAGGRIETDLFFDDAEREILLDPALVDKLARAKAQLEADAVAKEAGWGGAAVAPIGAPSWATPPTPKDHVERYCTDPAALPLKERALRHVGMVLAEEEGEFIFEHGSYIYEPLKEAKDGEPDGGEHYAAQQHENWEVRRRKAKVRLRAARLAAPKLAGTPLDGLAFWPADNYYPDVDQDDDGNVLIELLIKIPEIEVDAQLAEAERQFEEAERAAKAAEGEETENGETSADAETEQEAA